jgi:hypothetical protein
VSKGPREIAALRIVARPSGVRIRTRPRVSERDLDVLLRVGGHLAKLAGQDLATRVRLGNTKEDRRAARKRALTGQSSSRWADAITRTSNDRWRLSWRAPHARRTSPRRAIDTIQRRLAVPVGEHEGKTRSYAGRRERFLKGRRPRVLKARLARVEERIEAGEVRVVRGGRGLFKQRRFQRPARDWEDDRDLSVPTHPASRGPR